MKKYVLLLIALVFMINATGCGNNEKKEKPEMPDTVIHKTVERIINIGGTYSFGADLMKGPAGSIKIYPLSETTALFYLDVNRGAPSYNMALLAAEMKQTNGSWLYNASNGSSACTLKFSFDNSQVKIEVISGQENCGFGGSVNVAQTYTLTDRNIPSFYISGEGDTVKFDSLKPSN